MTRVSSATLGFVLVLSVIVLSLPTVFELDLPGHDTRDVLVVFALVAALAAATHRLPWDRLERRWLLVWPLAVMVGLAVGGLLAPQGASETTLVGLFVLAFFYIGITQRPWTGAALLPFAFVCLVACFGHLSDQLLARLPITLGIWIIVSESVARFQAHVGRLTAALEEQVRTDPLTGLASRRLLAERLTTLGVGDAIVFIDIDNFKVINDRFGHAVGDQVLVDMGNTLRQVVRIEDLAVRFGGEELLLVLHHGGHSGAVSMLQRITQRWREIRPDVTFSAGISVVAGDTDPASAVQAADRALYAAKAAGRDCWRLDNANAASRPAEIA